MPFWKTKREGYIYVIRMIDSPHRYTMQGLIGCNHKIGKSTDVPTRRKAIGLIVPYHTYLVTTVPTIDIQWAETYVHRKLADVRTRGEWFRLSEYHMQWFYHVEEFNPDQQELLDEEFRYRTQEIIRPDDMPYPGNDSAGDLGWNW